MKKSPGRKARRRLERENAKKTKAEIKRIALERKIQQEAEEKAYLEKFKSFAKSYVEGELRERYGEPKAESE